MTVDCELPLNEANFVTCEYTINIVNSHVLMNSVLDYTVCEVIGIMTINYLVETIPQSCPLKIMYMDTKGIV